jgi:hypothetical protein
VIHSTSSFPHRSSFSAPRSPCAANASASAPPLFEEWETPLPSYTSDVAGYTHLYVIGGEGGFSGSDGVNAIQTLILVGEADRMWLEGRYFDACPGPMGKLKTMVPAEPEALDALLDACLMFHPDPFEDCPSFATVVEQLGNTEHLDFSHWTAIPAAWPQLREEARPAFSQLHIWRADLDALDLHG